MPGDDFPHIFADTGKTLHKSKHKAIFNGNGLSIGFVLRSVRCHSHCDKVTKSLRWDLDHNYSKAVKQYNDRTGKTYEQIPFKQRYVPDDIQQIKQNIIQYLGTLATNIES